MRVAARIARWLGLGLMAAFALAVAGCMTMLPAVPGVPKNRAEAFPPVLGAFGEDPPIATAQDWETRRAPLLRQAFEMHLYGAMPQAAPVTLTEQASSLVHAYGERASVESWTLQTELLGAPQVFDLLVIAPAGAAGPTPVFLYPAFCPLDAVFEADTAPAARSATPGFCEAGGGPLAAIAGWAFGEHIMTPPVEEILASGYALAAFLPGELMPDAREAADTFLGDETGNPPRALMVWAWAFSRVVDALEADPRFSDAATIAFGHSRLGKSALIAAAFDPRIDLVIAHQAGTGGAALQRDGIGESVAEITRAYPHWFADAYAAFAGREAELPVDQHQLIALVAPRPVLLGNARRDAWSDPQGTWRAARGAEPVYALYGKQGLDQDRLDALNPAADIAFHMRPLTHGVRASDWRAFLDFADAHLAPGDFAAGQP